MATKHYQIYNRIKEQHEQELTELTEAIRANAPYREYTEETITLILDMAQSLCGIPDKRYASYGVFSRMMAYPYANDQIRAYLDHFRSEKR